MIKSLSLVLSCLLLVEANPASSTSDLAALPASSFISASIASIDALSSAGFAISVPSEEEDDQENSPALAIVAAAHEEEEEEKSEENNRENFSAIDKEVDENIFASAGLAYNKAIGRLENINICKGTNVFLFRFASL